MLAPTSDAEVQSKFMSYSFMKLKVNNDLVYLLLTHSARLANTRFSYKQRFFSAQPASVLLNFS